MRKISRFAPLKLVLRKSGKISCPKKYKCERKNRGARLVAGKMKRDKAEDLNGWEYVLKCESERG